MRVGMDATPLLGRMTGIGTYTKELLGALAAAGDDELVATAFTVRGGGAVAAAVPAGVRARSRPVPARGLRAAWAHADWPPVGLLCGPVDVFHGTNFVLPPTGSAAGVLTVHDLTFLTHPETVSVASAAYRELVPPSVARARVVLTPSRAVAEQVCDAYALARGRVQVTPLGVDPSWFEATPAAPDWRAARGIPGTYVVAVGTLEPRKNLQALVAAHHALVDRGADMPPLVLVGGSGWGQALRMDGVRPERVVLTGHLEPAALRRVVAGAAALVFPSLDEGFGLPPLEALACGVPVLANDLRVLHEVLGDQATFVDATSDEALQQGLLAVLDAPVGDVRSRRAHASRYSWAETASLTRAAYVDAVSLAG